MLDAKMLSLNEAVMKAKKAQDEYEEVEKNAHRRLQEEIEKSSKK